jgi:hypothetical protein
MRPALVGAFLLAAACSGAPRAPSTGAQRAAGGPSTSAVVPAPRPSPAAAAGGGAGVLVAGSEQRGGLALELPASPAFVSAPLPVARPERYRSFAQASRIHVGRSHLQQVDLFPGETWLLAVSDDEATVRVYERASARLVGNHAIAGFRRFETGGVLAWPDGPPRFVVGSVDGLFLHDARTGGVLETFAREKLVELRFSPDRSLLVARGFAPPNEKSRLYFYAREKSGGAPSLRAVGALELPERVDAWDLSADNRLLATALYPSGDLLVVDLRSGTQALRVPGPDFGGDVAFSPDGRFVAMGGQGLLLVDLVNPQRRALYSQFQNNVGHVRFSPSGDAVVASSYDGRLRIFRFETPVREGRIALTLTLEQTLRHDGQANVYAFVFEANGDGLVSSSGDQTVRTFRGRDASKAPAGAPPRTFRPLADWARLEPEAARPFPPAPAPSMRDGHYHPPLLDGAPRPSSIRPGRYACKVDLMYKLRDCSVRTDAKGHTLLRFAPDNLLALEGVLYDDGPVVRFEGWLYEPSTVVGCKGCEKQPLHAVFRGGGNRFQGLLTFQNYYDPYVPPAPPKADEKIETSLDRFPLVLEYRGP